MNKLIKQAFTLIELLVVIAIIGILSGLIVVSMSGVNQKANIAKAQVFSNSLRNSLMTNIVGEWKFDIPVTTDRSAIDSDVIDTWGGVNNGNVTTPAGHQPTLTSSNCISGSCLSFDGVSDYIVSETADFRINDFQGAISAWVKSNNPSSYQVIFGSADYSSANRYIELFFRNDGKIALAQWNASGGGNYMHNNTVLSSNYWYYLVLSSDGSTYKIYINGTDQSLIINSGINNGDWFSDTNNRDNWTIGTLKYNNTTVNYMNGFIDDVRLYNAAIPTSQIKEQYFVGLNKLLASGGIKEEEYNQRLNQLSINK
jgi:prepilin-type N-terminal cleavage/methylation domain-containing protein